MTRTSSVFRKRWPFLAAVAVVLAVAVAAGSMFAANSGEQPIQEAAAAQVQPDLTDPGLYANPSAPSAAVAEPQEPRVPAAPQAVAPPPPQDGQEPGTDQVLPEGSSSLARWLADRPDEMGPFSIGDAMAADSLDVEWILYQAVEKDGMTEAEADDFRKWFDQRPGVDEAPELLDYQPPQIVRPGEDGSTVGRY
ncbi:MAG: hypothetical protein OXF79_01310 [Chloroflexi bacterium]|nr:hypothetical protein [Chloroflexota bacterium]